MNPPRFKVKGFVAVQYRDGVFGNYRAGGEGVESHLLLCQLCSWWDERGSWFVVRQAHHEGEWGCKANRRDCRSQSLQNLAPIPPPFVILGLDPRTYSLKEPASMLT